MEISGKSIGSGAEIYKAFKEKIKTNLYGTFYNQSARK